MHPKTAPAWVKASLKKTFAIERLRKAARAAYAENFDAAQASYAHPNYSLTDAVWRHEDPLNARVFIELRRALKELDACFPAAKGTEP